MKKIKTIECIRREYQTNLSRLVQLMNIPRMQKSCVSLIKQPIQSCRQFNYACPFNCALHLSREATLLHLCNIKRKINFWSKKRCPNNYAPPGPAKRGSFNYLQNYLGVYSGNWSRAGWRGRETESKSSPERLKDKER